MAAPMVRRLAAIRCKPPHFFANYPKVPGKCVDTNVAKAATCVAKDEQSLKPLRLFMIVLTIEGFGCASDRASFIASMVSRAACCLSASSSLVWSVSGGGYAYDEGLSCSSSPIRRGSIRRPCICALDNLAGWRAVPYAFGPYAPRI